MKLRLILPLLLAATTVALADPHPGDTSSGARNKDGSIVTGVLTARFDPAAGLAGLPIPNNLFFLGTTDLTLNAPTAGLDPATASLVGQLNAVDGFSTTMPWVTSFVDDNGAPGQIDPASVIPGQSVRVFQVTTASFVVVTSVVRELTPGVEYVAVASDNRVAIIPLVPLAEYSSYMAVLTNDINDLGGNDATPDQTYFLTKSLDPWVDANGKSTYPLLSDASAQALEQLRPLTNSMEAAGESVGIHAEDVIISWTVQTQSITPTLRLMNSITQAAPIETEATPFTTEAIGAFGLADITVGVITLPYYGGIPTTERPTAQLTDVHLAEPGAYLPPFDQFGLDPTSTNLTVANPFPVPTGMQTVPIIATVPNAASGRTKPATGWPLIVYSPSLTRVRTDVLALADAAALAGFAMVAMDQPLHGVVPAVDPALTPFYVENTKWADVANERTFDADFFNNETGAPGPDGIPDSSGSAYFNVQNFRGIRDNQRQAQMDQLVLFESVGNLDLDGDGTPDVDVNNVGLTAFSLGGFISVAPLAVTDKIGRGYFNSSGAMGIPTVLAGAFGERINGFLAGAGIFPGSPEYEQFVLVGQTLFDPTDPANWAAEAAAGKAIVHNTVIGDLTVVNAVPGVPMGGSEGLNRLMGLQSYSSTSVNMEGLRGVARFTEGIHSSFLDPTVSAATTAEMQGQMASFHGSRGTLVNVSNPDVLVPVVMPGMPQIIREPTDDFGDSTGGKFKRGKPVAGPARQPTND